MIKVLKITIFVLLLIFLATFLAHQINLPTDDLGRHIKMGEIIWQTKNVPQVNLFSYAEPDHIFINHHWLSEVFFYGLFNLIGFKGLVIFKAIILLIAFAIIYWLAIKRGGFFWATFFGFLCLLIFIERTDVRPEIFSYLLMAVYLWIFYLYERGKKKIIWCLAPLQLLWVNLHIYFFVGIFLILVFVIQRLVRNGYLKRCLTGEYKLNKESKIVLMLLCFSALVLLANPNFIQGALYPLNVLNNYGYDIVENKSPFFLDDLMDNPAILYFKIWLVLMVFGFVINHKRINIFDFLVGVFAIFMGWFALRNFPIAALLSLPIIAKNYAQFFNLFFKWLKQKIDPYFNYLKLSVLFVIILFLCVQVLASLDNNSKIIWAKDKPSGIGVTQDSTSAAEFYVLNKISGPVFNNFDIGSHLDFYLYPDQQVFVDNRPEAYSQEFWQYVYIPSQSDADWWRVFSQHYKFNSIFFGHTDGTGWGKSFINRIINDQEWTTVYLDQYAIILLKNIQPNFELIKKYTIPPDNVKNQLNKYKLQKAVINRELEKQIQKGKKYIQENFGPGIVGD